MAQLRRAKTSDNHLYILAGQSKGTWQVTDVGEQWLLTHNYSIPAHGESITLEPETFRLLRDKHYIFIKGIGYDKKTAFSQEENEAEYSTPDIPLLLYNEEGLHLPEWNLALELSVLSDNEQIMAALKSFRARYISASGTMLSPSVAFRRLFEAFCILEVQPQSSPYTIFWEGQTQYRNTLTEISNPPKLRDNWQGNIFIKSTEHKGYWYHAFPGSAITYPVSKIRWLAKTTYEPDEWPGIKYRIGQPDKGWQLWWLELQSNTPSNQEEVKNWFLYRGIELMPPYQSLKVISPVDEVIDPHTGKKWYCTEANQSLLIQCTPIRRYISEFIRDVRFVDRAVNKEGHVLENIPRSYSKPTYSDQISYFHWSASQAGQHRLSLTGDAVSEPMFIQVKEVHTPSLCISWLRDLCCTVTSPHESHIFHAFESIKNTADGTNEFSKLTLDDLPKLHWRLEPEGLPIYVRCERTLENIYPENTLLIQSSEALTTLWQNQLCSEIRASKGAKIILDGGSFGLIELSFTALLTSMNKEQNMWWKNSHLCSQLIWLSNAAQKKSDESITTVPATLYQTLLRLRESFDQSSVLYQACNRLLTRKTIPTWVFYRLQSLLQEIEKESNA